MECKKNKDKKLNHLLSAPIIYSIIFPLIVLDIFIEFYHYSCFSLYGIPLVDRKLYIKFDRHKLNYLNVLDKVNCTYCAYANGLLTYSAAIAARTEKYWCGIKHQEENMSAQPHHKEFLEYGDREEYMEFTKDGAEMEEKEKETISLK